MMRHNPNAWRWNLYPRDPEYLDEPIDEERESNDEMLEFIAESRED